jgi:hypothetical protein
MPERSVSDGPGVPPGPPGVVPAPYQPDWSRARLWLAQVEAEERAEAYREAQERQIEALDAIREEIHDLPKRQYIWGD